MMNILAIGAGGNLGAYFCNQSRYIDSIQRVARDEYLSNDFTINGGQGINLPANYAPDLIINFANAYFPSANPSQVETMKAAIVGVSESIAITSAIYSAPVLSFSSYFQYPPTELRPWSAYSLLKDQGIRILQNSAYKFIELTLRDNYGGHRRDKFFDAALTANINDLILDANPGDSLLNLIHVQDICAGIDDAISNLNSYNFYEHFELRNQNSNTLREVVATIDSETGRKTKVNWGAIPYREKEVFEDWKCAEVLPNWYPQIEIGSFIRTHSS